PTSFLCIWLFTALYCFAVWRITESFHVFGIIGSTSIFHSFHSGLYSSGSASVTRWPSPQVTIYRSPSMVPCPFFLHFSTLAMSLATDGFSAITNDFIVFLYSFKIGFPSRSVKSSSCLLSSSAFSRHFRI